MLKQHKQHPSASPSALILSNHLPLIPSSCYHISEQIYSTYPRDLTDTDLISQADTFCYPSPTAWLQHAPKKIRRPEDTKKPSRTSDHLLTPLRLTNHTQIPLALPKPLTLTTPNQTLSTTTFLLLLFKLRQELGFITGGSFGILFSAHSYSATSPAPARASARRKRGVARRLHRTMLERNN